MNPNKAIVALLVIAIFMYYIVTGQSSHQMYCDFGGPSCSSGRT